MRRIFEQIVPFIIVGVGIALLIFGAIILFYLLLTGALVGLTLYLIALIREKFFASKKAMKLKDNKSKPGGRTIDSDDWKKL